MPETPTAVDVACTVADALERHGIIYAIGGALALGFYAPPRATVDVDVNAFVAVEQGLDRPYIRQRLVEFVGEDDERLAAFSQIERDIDSSQ